MKKARKVGRSAITGEFISVKKAEKNKETSVVHIFRPTKPCKLQKTKK